MSEDNKAEDESIKQTQRLTAEEFMIQLDTADQWMIWRNPVFDEIELVVKDPDGNITPFWGPKYATTSDEEYEEFSIQVEKMAEKKEQ